MGVLDGTTRLLVREAAKRPFSGRVLTFGRMDVFVTPDELDAIARENDFTLKSGVEVHTAGNPALATHGCLDDRSFFKLLGFDEVTSVDVSAYEDADVVHDLNLPVPESLHGKFDVVFEGGTIQHVFHVPQVLANIHALLAPGGRVIHGITPAANYVDHGFYTFSPTLFQDFYTANGWQIDAFVLFDFVPYWVGGRLYTSRFRVYPYQPGRLDEHSYGRWGNRQTAIFLVATKTEDATGDRIPQQGFYRQQWQIGEPETNHASRGPKPWDAVLKPLKLARERLRRLKPTGLPPRQRL